MKIRDWATPLTIGSFVLIAVTGVLMFFHLDTGLNKVAHEWLGWALLAAVAVHGAANFPAFKRHFSHRAGIGIVAAFVLLLGASFISPPGQAGGKPPHLLATQALLDAPLPLVAQVAGKEVEGLVSQLQSAGFTIRADQSLRQAAAGREQQMKALGVVFGKAA